jgi:hypothetical protein
MKGDGPESSFASDTRQFCREDRLRSGGRGPSGYVVIAMVVALIGVVIWIIWRSR